MRVNIYREELPTIPEVEIVWTEPRPGVRYCGVRVYLRSAPELHHYLSGRSAVTFWVGSLDEANYFVEALRGQSRSEAGVR